MEQKLIYLDNAATTKLNADVAAAMAHAEEELFYNSGALYSASLNVKRELKRAEDIIKNKLTRTGDGEVIFTSGATEANNMVIFGKITNPRQHMVVLLGEHSSVYSPSVYLKNQGFDVDYLPLKPTGELDLIALRRILRYDTTLLCFGMVNSDTGCLQNMKEIVQVAREISPKVHIHVDAVQGFCKYNFDAGILGLDSVVVSSHKINGPKGVGALYIRKGANIKPIMHGGSQQGFRPGTENNAGIIGFARAVEVFDTIGNYVKMRELHNILLNGLPQGCAINGINNNPYITNIMLPRDLLGQTVMNALSSRGICVGLGSACSAVGSKNRTLMAMGIPDNKTKQVLRVSFGANNTKDDVSIFLKELTDILKYL